MLLTPDVEYRGFNTVDPVSSGWYLTPGTASNVAFNQACNRIVVQNLSGYTVYVKFGGATASPSSYDLVLWGFITAVLSLNFQDVSLYSASAAHVALWGYRVDNENLG